MYAFAEHSPRLRSTPSNVYEPYPLPVSRPPSPSKFHRNHFRRRRWPKLNLYRILKYVVPCVVSVLLLGLYLYEPHIEVTFYNRSWIEREVEAVLPLAGCFNPLRVSELYNVTDALYGPRHTEIQAGMGLRFGLDCYELAGTIHDPIESSSRYDDEDPPHIPGDQRIQYHTYWRTDLAAFDARQDWMLKSYFATQNIHTSRLILWSNGDLSESPILQDYLRRYPDAFVLKRADKYRLARGTELEGSSLLRIKDDKAWVDGDLIRLLVLWHYGGVWVDMDTLLTRDLNPLLEHEFVTQWDCYDKKYQPFNGALMRFRQHSPYLCEAFHIIRTSPPPRAATTDWGSLLYLKLWRRLIAGSIPPFKILPYCFSDARSCRLDNRLPDPFAEDHPSGKWTRGLGLEEGGGLDRVLSKIFAIHLHNQWEKHFPRTGWVSRLLLQKFEREINAKG